MVIPVGGDNCSVENAVETNSMLVRQANQIILNLGLLGKVPLPGRVEIGRIAVRVDRRIGGSTLRTVSAERW